MKLKLYLLGLILAGFMLQSCDDDDDDRWITPPNAVQAAFQAKYPGVTVYDWEFEYGLYKAEYRSDGKNYESWFEADGTWVRTESDYYSPLPQPVQDYLTANYPDYRTEDVDWVETPTGNYFLIELERYGGADVYLRITEDGTVVN